MPDLLHLSKALLDLLGVLLKVVLVQLVYDFLREGFTAPVLCRGIVLNLDLDVVALSRLSYRLIRELKLFRG